MANHWKHSGSETMYVYVQKWERGGFYNHPTLLKICCFWQCCTHFVQKGVTAKMFVFYIFKAFLKRGKASCYNQVLTKSLPFSIEQQVLVCVTHKSWIPLWNSYALIGSFRKTSFSSSVATAISSVSFPVTLTKDFSSLFSALTWKPFLKSKRGHNVHYCWRIMSSNSRWRPSVFQDFSVSVMQSLGCALMIESGTHVCPILGNLWDVTGRGTRCLMGNQHI